MLYALALIDGSHRLSAKARDILLVMADTINLVEDPSSLNISIIRYAADRCAQIGPFEKSIELYRQIAPLSNSAEDYFRLSEVLAQGNYLEESINNLSKAIQFDSINYGTESNKETLKIGIQKIQEKNTQQNKRLKIGRYPNQSDFLGDLIPLIKNHIAINLKNHEKFINQNTRFFTMGSCFARSISLSLSQRGFHSNHLEISEYVNTTFANKAFVDWMKAPEITNQVNSRFKELIPTGWSEKNTLQLIKSSNVFIITLGVAPAFFDRETGEFQLPRPTTLNSRVLAEKYIFRTTTVEENVDNVMYLIDFVRSISPEIKIVITVSPVPILASFEFESCVQADCLSKSVMRLVAHEVVNNRGLQNIIYWPSFEVFRWGGSNASSFYSADDGAAWHVSEAKVSSTVEAFLEIFNSSRPSPK